MANSLRLEVSRIMARRGLSTKDVAASGAGAYNTVLAYRRGSSERLSRQALEGIAEALSVDPWELFYNGQYCRPVVKIAEALGIEADSPVTQDDYKALFTMIADKVGARLGDSDFAPLPEVKDRD